MLWRCKYLCLIFLTAPTWATPLPCDNDLLLVETEDVDLHNRVCKTASAALPRLDACHLTLDRPVTFAFETGPPPTEPACLGLYHTGKDRIILWPPATFAQLHATSEYCGTVPAPDLFDSIVVHELAHALTDQSACRETACTADREYIAYALQIDSLHPGVRDRFIAESALTPPFGEDRLNDVILAFSPATFAAAAWLHFSAPENGCAFVGRILRGDHTLWRALD